MAYSTNNRPYLVVAAIAGGAAGPTAQGLTGGSSDVGGNVWAYRSTDTAAAVAASNYFTDGWKLGLRKGDIMFITHFSTALAVVAGSVNIVNTVNASSAATVGIVMSSS